MQKTVTKTTYICDGCKKELLTPFAIKGSVQKQHTVEFEFHFCDSCFGKVASAIVTNLTISGNSAGDNNKESK